MRLGAIPAHGEKEISLYPVRVKNSKSFIVKLLS